jgi:hypothetical protein
MGIEGAIRAEKGETGTSKRCGWSRGEEWSRGAE